MDEVTLWLNRISTYEQEFEKWESRVEKINKRYIYDNRTDESCKYNILWSNVQTLTAATFSRIPKPDVSRRFRDQDPVGRLAGTILERALDYEVHKYSIFASTLKSCVSDKFLGGRGTAWVRYEPHFKTPQTPDGIEITEDVDEPHEELDYECAPCDYVHWRDFGHSIARTWEEVEAVWRKVFLTRDQCVERFGDAGKEIPLDANPDDFKKKQQNIEGDNDSSRALVYEIWDKSSKQAIWLSKSLKSIIDTKDDPLELDNFFPCPRPLFSTLTNDSLVPVPDFTLYQDQANGLDVFCKRIDSLARALKITGCYDSSLGAEIARIFTEGSDNTLVPVSNWTAFSEKNGLKGAIDVVDLTPIASALTETYGAMEQAKQQIYDITGISDIIRGQTTASETATAQQIKGQYASLRLKTYQDDVARFSTEILQIQAQIICKQFSPQTIISISAADQLPEYKDQQLFSQAIELLTQKGPNPTRMFRIEVAADSLIQLDEQQEKQDRIEFLTSISSFMNSMAPLVQAQPSLVPLVSELIKFAVRAFKVGKSVESAVEMSLQQIQQNPQPDPQQLEQQQQQLQQQQQQVQEGLQQIEQGKQLLQEQQNKIKDASYELEEQKLELEKKTVELGFRESLHSMDKQYTKSSDDLKKTSEEVMKAREDANSENSVAESAKQLSEIAKEHMNISAEAAKQITDGIQSLIQVIEASQQPRA